jgi:UDP-N-acetylglucosamine 2-epimerase
MRAFRRRAKRVSVEGHMAAKILCVAGARPNFMKIAPLLAAFREAKTFEARLVHTGQHYDAKLSKIFFEELAIPRPHVELEVGSGSHAQQTADDACQPSWAVVESSVGL